MQKKWLKKKTHPRDNEDARGHWLFKMTFTNTIGMAALFLSVQRTPTSKPPRDYLIFPFHFFFALFSQNHFNVRASCFFSTCCRYLIMAGWAGSTTMRVLYDENINGPTPDALSVRCSLCLSLSPSLSLCLSVSLPALSPSNLLLFLFSLP